MQVKASVKYLRISPKKARLVARAICGMEVTRAIDYLKFIKKKAAGPLVKLLKQALANAQHNFKLNKESLFIKEIFVDKGPVLKRWRPRAFGRAAPIQRKRSHISVILEEKIPEIPVKKPRLEVGVKKATIPEEPPFKGEGIVKEEMPAEILSRQEKKRLLEVKDKKIFDIRRKAGRRTKQYLDKIRRKGKRGVLKRIFRRKSI